MSNRKRVLHLTRDDFEWSYFKASGGGGQHRDKTDVGVRCFHRPSGAEGRHSDTRSRVQNRKRAFRKCVESKAFQQWAKIETCRAVGQIDQAVKEAMRPENLVIEHGPFDRV